ncbi:MAG: replication-associated recombination protein A [Bacteroidetes bacterium]|nr:MAG: replication-associated recombination protein A [Bacteroidota bacterium]
MLQNIPLSERLRPKSLNDFFGQSHLVGQSGVMRKILENKSLPSIIFWGPPGVGKTTLAGIIATHFDLPFVALSAISAGVKEVREVIEKAKFTQKTILFIDEIHRFNKSQQDALLAAVEKGIIVLIGATTENPSFEVVSALLSRCQVYVLKAFETSELEALLHHAIQKDDWLRNKNCTLKETEALIRISGGDARKLLNLLELIVGSADENTTITDELVLSIADKNIALYDKNGEQHYDIISAFIKSIRGSDPNAAVYYLARMIEGGEDVSFIARRLLILASEDIGNANPTALVIANNCFQAVNVIGYPEAEIILSQCVTYLAASAKSNAAYNAIKQARVFVKQTGDLPVPLALRNAQTKLMKNMDYGKDYKYSHLYDNNFVAQEFMPEKAAKTVFYEPGKNPREEEMRQHLRKLWKEKYGY